jgi:Fe2+ or Zn2+ uptake regulation protein
VGLRVTQPRLRVYEALARLGGHRTADEVADAVASAGRHLSRTSVYNALDALRSANLVMVADAGPGATLHEVAGDWHHHFVCRTCGDVVDVPCRADGGEGPCLHLEVPGAVVEEAQVILRGTCARCTAAGAAR